MTEVINFPDFLRVEMRVGLVVAAIAPEWSEKLLELTVDLGEEIGQRTILSGIKMYYSAAELEGRKFPFVVNLAPRKMGPSVSQGMMLMVDAPEKPLLIEIDQSAPLGSILT